MKIGISTPMVVQMPGAHAAWERVATVEDLSAIARTADDLGFHHLTCSEHVAVPEAVAKVRGGVYWDPVATLSFLAAHTRRIRLATSVIVLGYHHPLEIAKRYGTLDRLSGGRVVLGVGVGSLQEEFDLLGAQFEGRGPIADDALAALRVSLSEPVPSYQGSHYSFGGYVVHPYALQVRVPIWVGGRTMRSLRRAAAHADGWVPFGLSPQEMAGMLTQVDLPNDFEVVLSPGASLDPMGDPAAAQEALEHLEDAGATTVSARIQADSADHYREQLAALARIARLPEPHQSHPPTASQESR